MSLRSWPQLKLSLTHCATQAPLRKERSFNALITYMEKLSFFLQFFVGKNPVLLSCEFLPYVFPSLLTQNASVLILPVTEWAGGFLHTKQFLVGATSKISFSSTQPQHRLPGDTIRSHRLRAKSYKTSPPIPSVYTPHFWFQSQAHAVLLTSWLWVTDSNNLFVGFN